MVEADLNKIKPSKWMGDFENPTNIVRRIGKGCKGDDANPAGFEPYSIPSRRETLGRGLLKIPREGIFPRPFVFAITVKVERSSGPNSAKTTAGVRDHQTWGGQTWAG